uniref:Coat protein n=1 Tax=Ascaris lumbricoides TaxID=6252 RepID=A0A0M3IHZ0_ASCLU
MAASKRKRFRQRSMRRRRQMQTAIMSTCRQEVALAIRAKMTVIPPNINFTRKE